MILTQVPQERLTKKATQYVVGNTASKLPTAKGHL